MGSADPGSPFGSTAVNAILSVSEESGEEGPPPHQMLHFVQHDNAAVGLFAESLTQDTKGSPRLARDDPA